MKFLKTKNISKFSINDQALIHYPAGNGPGNRVVINAKGGLMLPKGTTRSEERRVGKECSVACRSRWSPYH